MIKTFHRAATVRIVAVPLGITATTEISPAASAEIATTSNVTATAPEVASAKGTTIHITAGTAEITTHIRWWCINLARRKTVARVSVAAEEVIVEPTPGHDAADAAEQTRKESTAGPATPTARSG